MCMPEWHRWKVAKNNRHEINLTKWRHLCVKLNMKQCAYCCCTDGSGDPSLSVSEGVSLWTLNKKKRYDNSFSHLLFPWKWRNLTLRQKHCLKHWLGNSFQPHQRTNLYLRWFRSADPWNNKGQNELAADYRNCCRLFSYNWKDFCALSSNQGKKKDKSSLHFCCWRKNSRKVGERFFFSGDSL